MRFLRRLVTGSFCLALVANLTLPAAARGQTILYRLALPDGNSAVVFSDGIAQIYNKDRTKVETQVLQPHSGDIDAMRNAPPDKSDVLTAFLHGASQPYEPGAVIVVFRDGVGAPTDLFNVDKATLTTLRRNGKSLVVQPPQYTNDFTTNRTLAAMATDRVERLFRHIDRSALSVMRSNAQARLGRPVLNIGSAYRLHVTGDSVLKAVATLAKLPSVVYASPDWRVSSMATQPIPLAAADVTHARLQSNALRSEEFSKHAAGPSSIPTNYGIASSEESFLNSPSMDAAAAFDEIGAKYHQLPGQGETITNVSLGDLDDAGAAANHSDPCNFYASAYGPTTIIMGGQRYLDLPSMPLIPTYTADSSGALNGQGEVCGVDPVLGEIGLDFSVMAPLPSALQRGGEQGSGLTDLLGIAPGANYRLVVPQSASPSNSDILAAMLGATQQMPRPNVINASIGFGYDQYGFSSRYLEDDPLAEAVIASVVQNYDVVVTIAAGDGVRTYTTVAIGTNGGTVPTELLHPGGNPTNLNDVGFSGVPSEDFDSGSIDVGGSTLDDLFARPPQYDGGPFTAQHAYAETRWTGFTNFSSGDGTRVNVSAPSDNITSFEHAQGGAADSVSLVLNGGTSASAPETAAAAAIALQVARLTGHSMTAMKIRDLLASTGSPVLEVPQADRDLNVGPQVDVRRVVETLLTRAGSHGNPSVGRVAIEQRRNFANLDGAFQSDTDPSNIALNDPSNQDRYQTSWITIAPDWEWLPAGAQFALYVTGHPQKIIATTPWARALPKTILAAAGLPVASTSSRTVNLTYEARTGSHKLAAATIALTFGPTSATHYGMLAPNVPPVVDGTTIPVTYDLTDIRGTNAPELIVSEPGRMSPSTGQLFHPVYTTPLTGLHGTVNVPVSALQGGGIYGVDVLYDSVLGRHSDPAFTRVVPPTASSRQASAPLLSSNGSVPGHFLEIPFGASMQVSYNVGNIAGATGAMLEISAAGPGAWKIYNPFNNPSGSICDNNGVDAGSVYCVPVNGTSGTVTVSAKQAGLVPTLNQVVRVIPMKFGAPAGEAGEVSTITMDGVFASDGGGVQNGFGVNPNGLDAYLTSGQQTASGEVITSLETFDQTNNQIIQNIASATGSLYYSVANSGIFGGDVGLFGLENVSNFSSTYGLINTVASGAIGTPWTPPANINNLTFSEAAENSSNDVAAIYGYDQSGAPKDNYRLFTSDILHNTFSSIYDISAPLQSEGLPNVWGLAENTTTNTGVLPAEDFFANCGAPTLVTVNLANGAVGSFQGSGAGFPYGIAIDSATNKAAVPTLCDGGLTIYDLAAKTGNEVFLPGNFNGFYTEADSSHGKFLVAQTTAPNFGTNNNSLSRVLVYDESGNLLETKEQFDLFGAFLTIQAHNLQANPARNNAYLIGPLDQQLEPFTY